MLPHELRPIVLKLLAKGSGTFNVPMAHPTFQMDTHLHEKNFILPSDLDEFFGMFGMHRERLFAEHRDLVLEQKFDQCEVLRVQRAAVNDICNQVFRADFSAYFAVGHSILRRFELVEQDFRESPLPTPCLTMSS